MVICIFCLSGLANPLSKNAGKDLVEIFAALLMLNSDFVEGETTLLMLLLYYMVEFSRKQKTKADSKRF